MAIRAEHPRMPFSSGALATGAGSFSGSTAVPAWGRPRPSRFPARSGGQSSWEAFRAMSGHNQREQLGGVPARPRRVLRARASNRRSLHPTALPARGQREGATSISRSCPWDMAVTGFFKDARRQGDARADTPSRTFRTWAAAHVDRVGKAAEDRRSPSTRHSDGQPAPAAWPIPTKSPYDP